MKLAVLISYFTTLVVAGLETDVCKSPACKDIAGIYKDAMDQTLDPCENFFKFACNNFIKKVTEIPGDEVQWGRQEIMYRQTKDQLISELEAPTLSGQPKWFQMAKDYYRSCVNTDIIEKYSKLDMKKRLKRYGGWPVLQENWEETGNSWVDIVKRLTKAGERNRQILSMGVDYNINDTSKRIIWVDVGSHVVSHFDLTGGGGGEKVKTYLGILIDIAVAFGADRTRAEQDMMDILQFETALSNLSFAGANDNNVWKNISGIQKQWPYIDWLDLVQTYIGDNLDITENEPIVVYAPSYVTKIADLLAKTSKRVIANYIMSQVILVNVEDLDQEILKIYRRMDLNLYGETEYPTRKRFCVIKLINNDMNVALGALYIRKYFSPQKKQKAAEITSIFQDQFSKIVADTDWLDNITKDRSVSKVKNIKDNIGYPDELLNDTVVTNYYGNLKVCPRDLYGNALALTRVARYRSHQKLRQPVDHSTWEDMVTTFLLAPNSDYYGLRNSLDILSGILHYVFFDENRPTFVNYGSLASTSGFIVAKSLDTYGVQSDENGVYKDWWSKASLDELNKRADAIVKEYSTYVVKEVNMTVNGKNNKDDIIGRQAGIKIARTALDAWLATQKKDPRLVGLEKYTAPQIFWLAGANTDCIKERPEWLREDIQDWPSPPGEFRINGPFRQSAQFAKDWNCPEGSYMNPKEKFNVW